MRKNREMGKLSETVAAGGVEFPAKVAWSFDRFRLELMEVLEENDLGGSSKWDWNEIDQTFDSKWKVSHVIEGMGVSAHRGASLDPRKPIAEEVARLIADRDVFTASAWKGFRAMTAALMT
jgi:hypothetical protein